MTRDEIRIRDGWATGAKADRARAAARRRALLAGLLAFAGAALASGAVIALISGGAVGCAAGGAL